MDWVLICMFCEMTGCTDDAVRAKIKRGYWVEGLHWKRSPDNRIWLNVKAIKSWIEGKA